MQQRSVENKVNLLDGFGNSIKSFDGAINVHDPHGHTVIINERFHQHTEITTTFGVDAPAGSISINLVDATGFAVGNFLHLQDGVVETHHPQITVLSSPTGPAVATLDRPLDNSFFIGDTITKSLQDMNVSGTLTTPQSFKVVPPSTQTRHLETFQLEMTHGSAGDNGLFGNLPKLTNGVVLRFKNGITGKYTTYTNWKTNGDITTDFGGLNYSARSGGGGNYGTDGKGDLYRTTGAIIRIDGTVGDFLEILIQDNLSSLNSFKIKVQGHIEGI